MERRLGRGLGALLPDSGQSRSPREIELDSIRPNPFQPRTNFRPSGIDELRQSIAQHGVLQPVVVRRIGDGYELISGERRWRASREAGLRVIPAVVRPQVSDGDMLELALVENLQREDLDPIERARGFRAMMDQLELTQERVAERVGLRRSTIANHLRLLELPETIQEAVRNGTLSMGHARALLGLQDQERLLRLASDVVEQSLSVRDVERLVREGAVRTAEAVEARQASTAAADSATGRTVSAPAPWIRELEQRMQDHLGTKVTLKNRDGFEGQVVIEYYGRDDLDRLIQHLSPDTPL
jgi:ParB family chromosome partitioning protein